MKPVERWTGAEAHALRQALRLSVRDFAERLGVASRTIARWEAGRGDVQPRPDTEAILDTALDRASEEEQLRFVAILSNQHDGRHVQHTSLLSGILTTADEERLTRAIEEPRRADSETVEYFRRLLEAYTRTDSNLTPADLIAAMTPAYETLGRFRRDARPPVRGDLHALASRYAQLIGRMHYEAGALAAANSWSDQALLAAHEAGDEQLVAYTLARRASLAGAAGDAGQVVDLATAARERVALPAHIDAMARRHEAQGHAMTGGTDLCLRRLDEAAELLVHGSRGEEPPYASGFSLGFHDVQAAGCYVELGRPAQAAEILERELPKLRADYVKAYNLTRLAQAYANMHERDRATEVARKALILARETGAGRALQALRRVQGDLAVWWD